MFSSLFVYESLHCCESVSLSSSLLVGESIRLFVSLVGCLFLCLRVFVCLIVNLFVCESVCLWGDVFCLFLSLFVCEPVCEFACLFVGLCFFVFESVCLFVSLFVCVTVCLFVSLCCL